MDTKELKIEIPEGYCIDESKSTFEKIIFKKKDTKPRSWEEYCKNNEDKQVWFVTEGSNIGGCHLRCRPISLDKNTLPSKELAEAFLAMMQLVSLRKAWVGDWEPSYNINMYEYGLIRNINNNIEVSYLYKVNKPLSFPSEEMAKDFLNCFKDLLEIAKPIV